MSRLAAILSEIADATRQLHKDTALAPIERQLETDMRAAFRRHQTAFFTVYDRYFREADGPTPIPELENALENAYVSTKVTFTDPIIAAGGKALVAASEQQSAELCVGGAFDLKHPKAIAYLEEHAAEAVTNIDATTRKEIRRIVTKGMDEGWGYNKVAAEIRKKYAEFGVGKSQAHIQTRAHLIAVTEAAEAYEEGSRLTAQELNDNGLPMEKAWSDVGDQRVSDGCLENSDAGWIDIDDPFPSGHMHAPRFPGCRCTVKYRRKKA